jgi:hypothetical protein
LFGFVEELQLNSKEIETKKKKNTENYRLNLF